MPEEWIVRVHGKEYGPVDADELREWRQDGRLIRENEVRAADSDQWFPAGELVEVFGDERPPPPPPVVREVSLVELLTHTWLIYRARFWQFLGLSALLIVPSIVAQLSSTAVDPKGELDLRAAVSGLIGLAMFSLSLVAWPIYVAGLQILSQEAAEGRSATFSETVQRAVKYWPRVALLCLLVYGAFFLLLVFAFAILLMVAAGPPNILLILVALALLFLQVWMFGRLFIHVLFWQQTAVLENADTMDALRLSKELARSRPDLSWWRRPLGRGAILASLWFILATALSIGPEWSALTNYFHALTTTHDAQAIVESMTASAKSTGFSLLPLALNVLQTVLRPLLGISFVVLYLDSRAQPDD